MREIAELLMLSGRVVRLALDKNDTAVPKAQADCPSESALNVSLSISRLRVSRRVALFHYDLRSYFLGFRELLTTPEGLAKADLAGDFGPTCVHLLGLL